MKYTSVDRRGLRAHRTKKASSNTCCLQAARGDIASSLFPFKRNSLSAGRSFRVGKACRRLCPREIFFKCLKPAGQVSNTLSPPQLCTPVFHRAAIIRFMDCADSRHFVKICSPPFNVHCSIWLCDRTNVSSKELRLGLRPSKIEIRFLAAILGQGYPTLAFLALLPALCRALRTWKCQERPGTSGNSESRKLEAHVTSNLGRSLQGVCSNPTTPVD